MLPVSGQAARGWGERGTGRWLLWLTAELRESTDPVQKRMSSSRLSTGELCREAYSRGSAQATLTLTAAPGKRFFESCTM